MASEDGRAASDEEAVPEQQVTLNEQMMYHVLWQNDLLLGTSVQFLSEFQATDMSPRSPPRCFKKRLTTCPW